MALLQSLCLFFVLFFTGLMGSLEAYQFNVGGKEGWVLNPSEIYNNWSGRMRFQVNDTLFFKYNKGSDSVLVVSKEDYDQCNTQKPIMKMDGGDSVFKFDRSGPFYFISGNKGNCDKGQKLTVVVLAVRPKKSSSPPSPTPIAPTPATHAPAPSSTTPASSPFSTAPVLSPPSPPTISAPSPSAPAAATPPSTMSPPAGSSLTPGGGPTANINSTARPHSSAPALTPSILVTSSVTLVLSACLANFVTFP